MNWLTGKMALYITIIGIVIVLVMVFVLGRSSKKGGVGSKPLDPKDLPNSGSGIPKGWSPTGLAEKLYNQMNGVNWGCYKDNGALFQEYASLATDDMFAAVALDFKNRYNEQLYEFIDGETPCGLLSKASSWKAAALNRMERLNLQIV